MVFIAIATIDKYSTARSALLESLPESSKQNTLLVFSGEPEDTFPVRNSDGILEVRIRNNIYEYGLFVGLKRAFDALLIPASEDVLLLHDTCRAGPRFPELLDRLVAKKRETKQDIFFASNTGQCNLCIVNRAAVEVGYSMFHDMMTVPKMRAIKWEWEHHHKESPKGFPGVSKGFSDQPSKFVGTRKVYSDVTRSVLYYPALDLEKYYVHVDREGQHAQRP